MSLLFSPHPKPLSSQQRGFVQRTPLERGTPFGKCDFHLRQFGMHPFSTEPSVGRQTHCFYLISTHQMFRWNMTYSFFYQKKHVSHFLTSAQILEYCLLSVQFGVFMMAPATRYSSNSPSASYLLPRTFSCRLWKMINSPGITNTPSTVPINIPPIAPVPIDLLP